MHTHFGSATHLVSTFLGVLIVGTFWRIVNLRILAFAHKSNKKHLAGLAEAALGQY